jgi:hypothetical protein
LGVFPKTCRYGGGYSSVAQIEGNSLQTKVVVAGRHEFDSELLKLPQFNNINHYRYLSNYSVVDIFQGF